MSTTISNATFESSEESTQGEGSVHGSIASEDLVTENTPEGKEQEQLDIFSIGISLDINRKTASAGLLRILETPNVSNQEICQAQEAVDRTKTHWNSFMASQKALSDTSTKEVMRNLNSRKSSRDAHTNKQNSFVPPNLPIFQLQGGRLREPSKKIHDTNAITQPHSRQALGTPVLIDLRRNTATMVPENQGRQEYHLARSPQPHGERIRQSILHLDRAT
ncbi:hypothetical protein PHYBLDRAFT_163452 [Phycomyces blakesleeanus NRRL 1555(-)]|uniref:Uncharacterized protein n=1 Tax=Phycomyces blakesleeanus (strain ATCC 8743b / DSM 1359 / FGSC 10004 / NBRC 33097 / NRRL 1555) TaxID=763407 RepID=A0A167PQ17_PHYB8|nr:hypothetical protein PHYBLDRAFT_163452 [Phycomyces blakesleeanus NRRL 1555(-)]OAD78334.1 hypothetical protein PHYBLDRAFT_163452 [Phycomyces blakesleeanus NRRL 1555(-)]|eukprot:XP_018296374.1 hypothetical protein PHYBLDRAFT_163452 [Phycomyces blakesleeanus NRRL 1555(-)]